MPLYDYCCPQCGFFEAVNGMAHAKDPLPCPVCQRMSDRVLRFAPALASMPTQQKQARERNEESAHAPKFGTKPSHHKSSTQTLMGRPWMIGH